MKAILFFVLISVSGALAQNRSIYLKIKDIQTDTVKKQIVFHYKLGNIAPKDSLGVIIRRANGQLVKLKSIYGDVGMTLTDGRKKIIFWNPVADRQKFDEDIGIFFIVKIGENQGLTRKQYFDLGRWTASAGLVGYSAWEWLSISKSIRTYNGFNAPINISAKETLDAEMNNIQDRQQHFYRIAAISAATVLTNIAISLIQSKYKLKSTRFGLTGDKCCVGVAYKF